ncbi:hypothetical protein DFH07DRAFT_727926 [Mycena maculata]|uniref:Uncharacterized protein n=1 Tax=Mycena maculata TaxID=230809 RepID=A0AAD7KEK8_9AGAR|nr:hypothetical protein DFH07DRAFT_727926 [Mycena maculata]
MLIIVAQCPKLCSCSCEEVRRKPLPVNWRDIHATIHGKPDTSSGSSRNNKVVESEPETPELQHPDPMDDGLNWLNDGLPDLRSISAKEFDLASEFDIQKYLHILADSVRGPAEKPNGAKLAREVTRDTGMGSKAAAESVAPQEDEWGNWS